MCQFSCIFVKLLYYEKCTALDIFVQYKLGLFPVYIVSNTLLLRGTVRKGWLKELAPHIQEGKNSL